MPFGAIVAKAAKGAAKSKAFEHLSKIKSREWKEMGNAFREMNEFSKSGGVAALIGASIDTIKTKIQNQVLGMFSPIINEVTTFTADLLKEAEPLGQALGDLIGFLKSLSIQIGDTNVSLLDLLLGFPLLIKAFNALLDLFSLFPLNKGGDWDPWAFLRGMPYNQPTLGPGPAGGSGRESGYQEF